MAQAIPCAICNEVPEAHWMVTSRDELTGVPAGTTFGLCVSCWVGMALSWLEAQEQAAQATGEAEAEASEAAIEAVTAGRPDGPEDTRWEYPDPTTEAGSWEESKPKPTPRAARKRAPKKAEQNGAEVSTETEAADVDG